ncbi:hypothetical protein [Streptomyces tanashiensis]|uniref:hypothetical protein n=1 Tax=Streptomyces tanashiensis TaxID=67367 RepID=UPI0033DAE29D
MYEEAGSPTFRALARRVSEGRSAASTSPTSISDWLNAKAVPARKLDLAALVATLSATTSRTASREIARFEELRAAAIRESRNQHPKEGAETWLGKPVENYTDPVQLEVHKPIQITGAPKGVPVYIERSHDIELRGAIQASGPQFVVLVGGSSAGKTRAAYEAARGMKGWRLYHPVAPSKPVALIEALNSKALNPRTILWLNELQDYLLPDEGERAAATLREFLDRNTESKVIATIWPRYWQDLTNPNGPYAHSRTLLNSSTRRIDIDSTFPSATLAEAAKSDARLRMAIDSNPLRITQYLAAGPALLEFFKDSRDANPGTWAIISAAMDAYAIGKPDSITDSFLRSTSPFHLSDEEFGGMPDDWFDNSLTHAAIELRGAARPLAKVRSRSNSEPCYRLADYLVQHAQLERRNTPVPGAFWDAVISTTTDRWSISTFARAADERGMFEEAAHLWWPLAANGNPEALCALLQNPSADTPSVRAALQELIDRVDVSNTTMLGWLLMELHEHPEEEERLARRICNSTGSLTTGPVMEMSLILRAIEEEGEAGPIREYATLIRDSVHKIDMSDFWSTLGLMEDLMESPTRECKEAARELAKAYFHQSNMGPKHLAAFLARLEDGSPLAEPVRVKLYELADSTDLTDIISSHPFIANLFAANEDDLADRLLDKICGSIGALRLGSSYAPLELLGMLRIRNRDDSLHELSRRISGEFDPVLSHSAVVALQYLKWNDCIEAFNAMAHRMAESGPILPLAGAKDLIRFFSAEELSDCSAIYSRRVQAFEEGEGN